MPLLILIQGTTEKVGLWNNVFREDHPDADLVQAEPVLWLRMAESYESCIHCNVHCV